MPKLIGRDREIRALQKTQRAAAVGRLLLGQFYDWREFLAPETEDFSRFLRRDLKYSKRRFKSGVSKEIAKFCDRNFVGMTESKLEKLFLKVKERRGLEMPLDRFEAEFAALKHETLSGAPRHCTVVVSLWGLQTKFPEDFLAKDIIESISQIREAEDKLQLFTKKSHVHVREQKENIQKLVRIQEFSSRACLLACFNLVEASLNGLAWDFSLNTERMRSLSNKQRALIEDGEFREKLIKYPEIISGKALWGLNDERVMGFLSEVKTFRDALVHASPFSRPERYGGLNKLEHIYRIDSGKAQESASRTVLLLIDLFCHIRTDGDRQLPSWLEMLAAETTPVVR